jgi:hypothetical protein
MSVFVLLQKVCGGLELVGQRHPLLVTLDSGTSWVFSAIYGFPINLVFKASVESLCVRLYVFHALKYFEVAVVKGDFVIVVSLQGLLAFGDQR